MGGSCGGFLIASNIVLTAASCNGKFESSFKNGDNVVVGNYNIMEGEGRDTIEIKETIIHPDYDDFEYGENYLDNDYMLVVLERDSIIQPVIIPENDDFLKPGDQVYAIGMGLAYNGVWSDDLLEVDLNYIANDNCDEFYSDIYSRDITNNMLCTLTPNKDTCQGDTGGPLIKRGEKAEDDIVVGITSFAKDVCDNGLPGVFARVSSVYDWIKSTVEDNGGTLVSPKTAAPTTAAPTPSPTTMVPTTAAPTTAAPTTMTPTTAAPTTMAPTTIAPTTAAPTTMAPTIMAPTTMAPTTIAPTTAAPTTMTP